MTPAGADNVSGWALHDQMLNSMAQIGRVVAEDKGSDPPQPAEAVPTVLVHIGGTEQGTFARTWMPWLASRAGGDAVWWKPDVDEQVLVLSPTGNPSQGIIIGSLFRGKRLNYGHADELKSAAESAHQFPDGESAGPLDGLSAESHLQLYRDGSSVSYDRTRHQLHAQLKTHPSDQPMLDMSAELDGNNPGVGSVTIRLGPVTDPPHAEIKMTATSGQTYQIAMTAGSSSLTIDENEIKLTVGSTHLTIDADKVTAT